ncbi:MAG TPA: hypothetical protein VFV37_05740 [Luteibaculaceae bacterium]|nr:hypothetical protein [Luteibaculaceae bacterium]
MKTTGHSNKTAVTRTAITRAGSSCSQSITDHSENPYHWAHPSIELMLIGEGMPLVFIGLPSDRTHSPIKTIAGLLDIPQTTYNKKLNKLSKLNRHETELIELICEILAYDFWAINREVRTFQRWLHKTNMA